MTKNQFLIFEKLFQVTIGTLPVRLIQELEPEEKNMVFKMIDTFLTKKKFKDFFQKNIAAM